MATVKEGRPYQRVTRNSQWKQEIESKEKVKRNLATGESTLAEIVKELNFAEATSLKKKTML